MAIPESEIVSTLEARHGARVQQCLSQATVGIMGLGGLGSNLAVSLTRMGVGKMLMADYDIVELSNINRQYYFLSQIGEPKTAALENNLAAINPYLEREYIKEKLTENNIPRYFPGVDILVECFDQSDMKASALRVALNVLPGIPFVCASGLAGYGASNEIVTREIYPDVFMVGDSNSAAVSGFGLMAPRVAIAANHQANQVIKLIIDQT